MVIEPIEISGGWCWHGIGIWMLMGPNNVDFGLNGQIIRGKRGIATTGAINLGKLGIPMKHWDVHCAKFRISTTEGFFYPSKGRPEGVESGRM